MIGPSYEMFGRTWYQVPGTILINTRDGYNRRSYGGYCCTAVDLVGTVLQNGTNFSPVCLAELLSLRNRTLFDWCILPRTWYLVPRATVAHR